MPSSAITHGFRLIMVKIKAQRSVVAMDVGTDVNFGSGEANQAFAKQMLQEDAWRIIPRTQILMNT